MLYNPTEKKRNGWRSSYNCSASGLIYYIEHRRTMHDAQLEVKQLKPVEMRKEGLETIEWVSLDCTNANKQAPWHSNAEIKIDKLGYVNRNGVKTQDFWDATIKCDQKPLRMKIQNICGDETVIEI